MMVILIQLVNAQLLVELETMDLSLTVGDHLWKLVNAILAVLDVMNVLAVDQTCV
jgi:hypothetical protein